jgi:hypothetical protein
LCWYLFTGIQSIWRTWTFIFLHMLSHPVKNDS